MQALSTIYRTVVMVATLAIVVMGWRHYGPSGEQLESLARRAVRIADEALGGEAPAPRQTDPRIGAMAGGDGSSSEAGLSAAEGSSATAPRAAQLLPVDEEIDPPGLISHEETVAPAKAEGISRLPPVDESLGDDREEPALGGDDPQIRAVLARLERLGAREVQLERWGSSGELYRFSCRVPWGGAASFGRHVESVAEGPLAAVEAVAAKVDAWPVADQDDGLLR